MRKILHVAGSIVGWLVVFVAMTAVMYAVAYAVSPFGPSCVTSRGGVISTQLPLWVTIVVPAAVATLLVALYWALGIRRESRRLAAVIVALGLAAAAGFVALIFVPVCT